MMPIWGKRIKAETAEEMHLVSTPNGVRKRIVEASFNDPMIRNVLDMARLQGWSGEDTYAFLAYHALVAKQEYEERMMDEINRRPTAFIVEKK